MVLAKTILVCQNKACLRAGSAKVLSAFRANSLPGVTIVASGCLGQCGNGPMVLIMPEQIWYCRVQSQEVPAVISRHLKAGKPIRAMLYPKFHPQDHSEERA